MLTVVHTLKSSSLTHSLQIHCIGLIGLRSHTSWAWTEKRDPTIYIYIYIYILEFSLYIMWVNGFLIFFGLGWVWARLANGGQGFGREGAQLLKT